MNITDLLLFLTATFSGLILFLVVIPIIYYWVTWKINRTPESAERAASFEAAVKAKQEKASWEAYQRKWIY